MSLEAPFSVEAAREDGWGASYRLVYGLRGEPGIHVLQQVRARVRYLLGDEVLVEYETSYGEWFRLGREGGLPPELHDVHDFCVHRDAWTPTRLRRLLARQGLLGRRQRLPGSGEPRVECHKEFLLGVGEVEEVEAIVSGSDQAAFGFFSDGPREPARSRIELRVGEGKRLDPPSAHPFGRPASGWGRFLPGSGWQAEETYTYRFATTSGRLEASGYLPVPLISSSAPRPCGAPPRAG